MTLFQLNIHIQMFIFVFDNIVNIYLYFCARQKKNRNNVFIKCILDLNIA